MKNHFDKTQCGQKGFSSLVGIIIVVAVAVVAVGGILAYQYFTTKNQPQVQNEQQNQNTENATDQTAGPPAKALATEGWKTYQNKFYGYDIKYPIDWTLEISPDLSHQNVEFWLPLKKFGIVVYVEQGTEISGKTLKEYFEATDNNANIIESNLKVFNSKNINISGYPAIQREEIHLPGGVFKELTTYLKNNNFLITIYTTKDATDYRAGDSREITDAERKIYNQILSTFKFTPVK